MARERIHHTETDSHPLGDGGGGPGQGIGAGLKVVLDEPHAAEPRPLGGPSPLGHQTRTARTDEGNPGTGQHGSVPAF
jgi:hypothetical protein